MKVIGYKYEADYHCVSCTHKRFGEWLDKSDNEGNPLNAVFDTDEISPHEVCGDCGEELDW